MENVILDAKYNSTSHIIPKQASRKQKDGDK
jgi:hypothetical protein